jgi:saccharopine dehydrogenase-like NADP-dependent oxidoreductase
MTRIAVLGAGQIGKAVYKILSDSTYRSGIDAFVIDSSNENILKLEHGLHFVMDLVTSSVEELAEHLKEQKVTHVINALPFFLNEKVAIAAKKSGCSYIDFTEDDKMADKVQEIFKDSDLNCAVKCGLAPGFVNYIGYSLLDDFNVIDTLMVSVGALPRVVSFDQSHPEWSYNLSWSVDGLVNEYIRPCRVRKNGIETEIQALNNIVTVIIDGFEYEAANTSGGVGSLVRDLKHVPNVHYMTIRYPGHYKYIRSVVHETHGNFDQMKEIFLNKFPFTNDDVIIVYSYALGKDKMGNFIRRSYSNKFYGVDGLSGIQATTAGSGVAILELMLAGKANGIINHTDVSLAEFADTESFRKYYKTSR